MYTSSDFAHSVVLAANRGLKSPENSNFKNTCNLLSQYLMDKRYFADINLNHANGMLDLFHRTSPTMNLIPLEENLVEISNQSEKKFNSMDLFPLKAYFGSSIGSDAKKKSDINIKSSGVPETAQMTIFYAGQVMVFDHFTADKAKELMVLASCASSNNPFRSLNNPVEHCDLFHSSSRQSVHPSSCVLPIMRNASIQRFLAKRKDRIVARLPYGLNKTAEASSSSPGKRKKKVVVY